MFFIKALGLVKSFILANWKWLLPLAAVVLAFLWTKDHYYDLGRETERTKWEKLVQKEKERNEIESLKENNANKNNILKSLNTFLTKTEDLSISSIFIKTFFFHSSFCNKSNNSYW